MIVQQALSDEEVNRFDREGAVTVDGPFTPEEIEAVAKLMDEMLPYEESKKDNYDATRVTRDIMSKGGRLYEYYNPALLNIYQHPFIEAAAKQLLYTDEVTFHSLAMSKTYPLRIAKKVLGEHLDNKYSYSEFTARPRRVGISAVIYFTDVNSDRAPFKFWPGSHIPIGKYYDDHPDLLDYEGAPRSELPDLPLGDPKKVMAHAGQITFFFNSILHGASENTDIEARKVIYLGLKPRDLEYKFTKNYKSKIELKNFYKELTQHLPVGRRHLVPEIN